jgi:DNA primase large subunit
MIRAPYSLHEKTGLVSLPLNPKDISKFNRDWAKPENVKEINDSFFNPRYTTSGKASQLLIQAIDFMELEKESESKEFKEFQALDGKQPKERFPPCIKEILKGLSDGKKRALFILLNFLKAANWDWPEIEAEIWEWNKKNNPQLKKGYIISQLSWHRRQPRKVPPPNCAAEAYYQNFGVCLPDEFCKRIKNPLSYLKRGK